MAKYIDKSTLVAEIESKFQKYWKMGEESDTLQDGNAKYWGGVLSCLNEVKTLIDTLEVKEVDLDEEINNYFNRISHFGKIHLTPEYDNIKVSTMTIDGFASIAKHFFELGLKAHKGE